MWSVEYAECGREIRSVENAGVKNADIEKLLTIPRYNDILIVFRKVHII